MLRIDVPEAHQSDPYSYMAAHYAPAMIAAGGAFARGTYTQSILSLREFEAARVRTAQINGCLVCLNFRAARDVPSMLKSMGADGSRSVIDAGDPPDEAFYEAIGDWRTSPLFSERERIAIEFAERFGTEPKSLAADEGFWTRARAAFTNEEIVDLAHCTASWVGLGRVAHVLGLDTVCMNAPAEEEVAA
jgi:alkylhydroperoxidase family enzyme